MTKYILHGGFERTDNDANRSFFKELSRDVPDGGTILLVYFASEDADISERFALQSERIQEQAEGKKLTFILATEEDFIEQLTAADVVHFRGGNTRKLLTTLRSFPDFGALLKDKTVSGSSAGAYALVRYGASHSEDVVREGLGFLPLRLACHYDSYELPPSLDSLLSLQDVAPELELVLLKDFEWRVFEEKTK